MFPGRYFPTRFFNERYWCKTGSTSIVREGIEYALGSLSLEYALPRLPEFTEPNDTPEFAL